MKGENIMLEKYLNKQVIIEEKLYSCPSTISEKGMSKMSYATQNTIKGIMTSYDEDFIELDNSTLISRKHIYRIIIK